MSIFNFTGRSLTVLIFQGEQVKHDDVKTFANSLHSPSVVIPAVSVPSSTHKTADIAQFVLRPEHAKMC